MRSIPDQAKYTIRFLVVFLTATIFLWFNVERHHPREIQVLELLADPQQLEEKLQETSYTQGYHQHVFAKEEEKEEISKLFQAFGKMGEVHSYKGGGTRWYYRGVNQTNWEVISIGNSRGDIELEFVFDSKLDLVDILVEKDWTDLDPFAIP